jgi:hypothetical protein
MAYEPDFYRPENIIGYTGDINLKPTVYFLVVLPGGNKRYGHITQTHDLGKRWVKVGTTASGEGEYANVEGPNLGRETVCTSPTYQMRSGPAGTLEEWDGGRCIHPSRNPLIAIAALPQDSAPWPVVNLDARGRYLLSCSIATFTEEKQWGDYNKAQRDQMIERRHF